MAAASHCEQQVVFTSEVHAGHNVAGVFTLRNQPRVFINHPIPHPPGAIISILTGTQQFPA
jgi:hypothetical protein